MPNQTPPKDQAQKREDRRDYPPSALEDPSGLQTPLRPSQPGLELVRDVIPTRIEVVCTPEGCVIREDGEILHRWGCPNWRAGDAGVWTAGVPRRDENEDDRGDQVDQLDACCAGLGRYHTTTCAASNASAAAGAGLADFPMTDVEQWVACGLPAADYLPPPWRVAAGLREAYERKIEQAAPGLVLADRLWDLDASTGEKSWLLGYIATYHGETVHAAISALIDERRRRRESLDDERARATADDADRQAQKVQQDPGRADIEADQYTGEA
jgi:hypothetical protein